MEKLCSWWLKYPKKNKDLLWQVGVTSKEMDDTGNIDPEPLALVPMGIPETLYHRDNVLLYIAYVMLIWAAPIPADRWHCSLWP